MSNTPDDSSGPRQHLVEVGVAAFMALLGVITIIGSLQVGIGWGAEGPKSGFFPFWIGLIVVATSLYNLVRAYTHGSRKLFANWHELTQVLKVAHDLRRRYPVARHLHRLGAADRGFHALDRPLRLAADTDHQHCPAGGDVHHV